jgi:SAM-dependent methyltransferase
MKNDKRIGSILSILDEGLGHKLSFENQKPVDIHGKPIPWFTYPAIEYLKQLDFRDLVILEWGIGNSSLFFASRCKEIFSVEHNKDWFDAITKNLPGNAHAILATSENYESIPLKQNKKFDVIIIDGIKRDDCVKTAVRLLKENGMIIFDNADRDPELCRFLRDNNLIEADFHGLGPINAYAWTTSIFFTRSCTIQPLSFQPLIPIGGGY